MNHQRIKGSASTSFKLIVAIARSPAGTHINSFSEVKLPDTECPKIQWPYGCEWRPEAGSRTKHLSMRSSNRKRFFR